MMLETHDYSTYNTQGRLRVVKGMRPYALVRWKCSMRCYAEFITAGNVEEVCNFAKGGIRFCLVMFGGYDELPKLKEINI